MTVPPPAEPLRSDTTAERVRLLIEARRTQDALRVAYEGLQADPTSAELLGLIGWALLVEGDAAGAREWAERSLGVDPDTAWVHDLRARALLEGAGTPEEARAAAQTAVARDPESAIFLFTLVLACLECRDRPGAERAAAALRHAAPESERGPLAAALIEVHKGRRYLREFSVVRVAVVTVITQGTALFILGIWWLFQAVLRAPYLRRADVLLHEALHMNPASASTRATAAEILRLRFRFAQSVDYEVAAAALDSGLIDAEPVARSISRRTAALAGVCFVVWVVGLALLDRPVGADTAVALVGLGVAVPLLALIAGFDRWQTRSLPPLLLRNVRGRWPLPAVAAVASVWVTAAAVAYLGNPGQQLAGYRLACLLVAPLVVASTVLLLARFVAARRRV